MGYIIIGVVCFIIGFVFATRLKNNINIGFGNKNITQTYTTDKKEK